MAVAGVTGGGVAQAGLLDRARIIAQPGFNRWLVLPAALAIYLCIGVAIMGFGGSGMIGAPLANLLMAYFKTDGSVGVWQTFVVTALIYFVFIMGGTFGYRIPPAGWRPEGWIPPVAEKLDDHDPPRSPARCS